MRRSASPAALVLSALCAAGCALAPAPDVTTFAEDTGVNSFEVFDRGLDSAGALVLPVVQDPQKARPSCGAHVLASVVNYWRGADAVRGAEIYQETPPAHRDGYSMAEIVRLARANDLLASAVSLPASGVIDELESGRPVLAPVRLPSVYVQRYSLPGGGAPVIGTVKDVIVGRAGRASEWTGLAMVDHYLLLAGYEGDTFVVVEPVMGYRTISAERLARFREPFSDAAIVFSGADAAPPGLQSFRPGLDRSDMSRVARASPMRDRVSRSARDPDNHAPTCAT